MSKTPKVGKSFIGFMQPGKCLIKPYVFVGNDNGVYNSEWKVE